jgi:N-acetylmuramoyl-L-alanine amidase
MSKQRKISWIILHCTATSQNAKVESILRYWRDVLKWKSVGYHVLIDPQGKPHVLASDEQITNGVKGFNRESIHISYIGGVGANGKPLDNRTQSQRETMKSLVEYYKAKYPDAEVKGHNDFTNLKACPSFKVSEWLKEVGL